MKRRPQRPQKGTKAARAPKAIKHRAQSIKSAKQAREGGDLEKMLSLIRKHPGIRPSELNRRLNREQSDALRNTLIKRGLIRKEKDGSAMRYYPIDR
jgi:DNA-binding MarR family transcriptional regulator